MELLNHCIYYTLFTKGKNKYLLRQISQMNAIAMHYITPPRPSQQLSSPADLQPRLQLITQEPVLRGPHPFIRLLGKGQRQHGMRQNTGQMGEETLVDGQQALCAHGLGQAVEDAAVQVAVLVVEAGHDGVGRVHGAADDEAACGGGEEVQSRAVLHVCVAHEPAFGEEVGGELDGGAGARANHAGAHAAVETAEAFGGVDLAHAVKGVAVFVLGADGEGRAVALQAGFDEEEGGAGHGAEDAAGGAGEDVDAERLDGFVAEDEVGGRGAEGFVETESAPVQEDLVDVRAADAAVETGGAFVARDDGDAVQHAGVFALDEGGGLQLALELESDFNGFEGVRRCYGAAGCEAARDEGASCGRHGVGG